MKNCEYAPRTNGNIEEKNSTKFLNKISTVFLVICLIASFFMLYFSSVYYSAEVVGTSMYPTINANNLYGNKTDDRAYYTLTKKASKGDIVIVNYKSISENSNFDAIKRLIATGGDTLCYFDEHILVNGVAIKEQYLVDDYNYLKNSISKSEADNWKTNGFNTSKKQFEYWCEKLLNGDETLKSETTFFKNYKTDYANSIVFDDDMQTYVLTLPENFVYFLGDNRGGSTDSSVIGPLESKYLLAKVDFITGGNESIIQYFWKQFLNLFY